MGVVTHKFVSGIADGGDATLVRPSAWNDQHAIAYPTGTVVVTDAEWINLVRVPLDGTDRLTLAGTARMYVFGWTDTRVPNIVGHPFSFTTPFRMPAGFFFNVLDRLTLEAQGRGILEQSARLMIRDDFVGSRIVLTGRG